MAGQDGRRLRASERGSCGVGWGALALVGRQGSLESVFFARQRETRSYSVDQGALGFRFGHLRRAGAGRQGRRPSVTAAVSVVCCFSSGSWWPSHLPASAATCTGNAIVCENQLRRYPAGPMGHRGRRRRVDSGFRDADECESWRDDPFQDQDRRFGLHDRDLSARFLPWRRRAKGGECRRRPRPCRRFSPRAPPTRRPRSTTVEPGHVSASWAVPATAVSGVYIARFIGPTADDIESYPVHRSE